MRFEDLLGPEDLVLRAGSGSPARQLGYPSASLSYREWTERARDRFAELIGLPASEARMAGELVRTVKGGDVATAVVRLDGAGLSLPGYLSWPALQEGPARRVVLGLHGHGEVEACLNVDGVTEDYHHRFSYRLARAGFTVFTPELRGFGALFDVASQDAGAQLRYWRWGQSMAYTLQSDSFLYGRTMMGDTIADLLAWEEWLAAAYGIDAIDVVGISWGGDLACAYPIFSRRVRSIFASGTLGSFTHTFRVGGNAPAHCIPGILRWLDRSDIAGLNAPTPIAIHYGELDTPRPGNESAAYNATADQAFAELAAIYAAAQAPPPEMIISDGFGHELDVENSLAGYNVSTA